MYPNAESPLVVHDLRKSEEARGRTRASRLRSATALAGGLLTALLLATPAAAQQTSGGNGGGPTGGAGGTSSATTPGGGGANAPDDQNGGGGGGAGTNGGAGGTGRTSGGVTVPGGAGGVGPGGDGGNGTGAFLSSSSGGGGGAHGYVGSVLPVNAATGGRGGNGGSTAHSGPGGGGAGGYGAVITGGGDLGTLSVSVTGGSGGTGGAGFTQSGFGGQGGHGLVLTAASTLIIGAAVNAGAGGSIVSGSVPGIGGYGIVGGDLALAINAAVSGGLNGDGSARGYSLFFTGGNNLLTLGLGGSLTGDVRVANAFLTVGSGSNLGATGFDFTGGGTSLTLEEGASLAGLIRVTGGSLDLIGENNLTGGIIVSGTLRLLWNNAAGGAGNTITTTGSVISYADGVDSATPIILASNTTQLEVLGADVATQSGAISETGGARPIEKIGTGTLILTGANSYSGGTLITGGLINFTSGDNLGTGNITLNGGGLQWATGNTLDISSRLNAFGANGGTFDTNGNDVTLAGVISGAGLTKSGAGTLTLTAANTYTGGTTIAGGLINFTSGDNLGTGNITLNGGGLQWATGNTLDISSRLNALGANGGTFDTNGNDITLASVISGFGGITKAGAGTLTLTGANTYAGGTTIFGGVVNFANGGNLGSGIVTLDGGALQWAAGNTFDISTRLDGIGEGGGTFDTNGNDVTFANAITGPGSITKAGAGTLILTADSFYAGATTISGGSLQVGTGGTTGTLGGGDIFNDGVLIFNRSDSLTVGGAIGGTGSLVHDGSGTLILTGENSYAGTTTISAGTLQIGDGGATGSLGAGNVVNDGSLVFNRDGEVNFGNAISGGGSLTQNGPGTLILTGANSYSGGTTINFGTVQIGNGGTGGSLGTGDIVNDGILVFNRSNDITVADDIFGSGSLTKLGAGTLTLTGFNEYVGTTSVQGGTLAFGSAGLFGTPLIEIGNGAGIRALTPFNGIQGDISILAGGGTIDTGAGSVDHFGSVNFGGRLTKTGSGLLLLNDGNDTTDGDGGIDVLAGLLGLGSDFAAGTGRIYFANGTTLVNSSCFCGLELDNDIEIELGGTATFDGQSRDMILNGQISGGNISFVANAGQNVEGGGSVFYLNGANEYGDTLIGPNVAIVLLDGTLGVGNTAFDPAPSNPFLPMFPALVFANSADYNYGGTITGNGMIEVTPFDPATTITLSGSNTSGNNFTGTVTVTNGRLNIDGNFGDIDNLTTELVLDACSCNPEDAILGGSGSFFGNVTVNNGTLSVGNSPGTLTIGGNLTLGAGTILNFEFGQPGVVGANINDLVTVGGQLTLDGTLNVIDFGPSYGPGYYRLFNYGTLVDNGLTIGTIAGGLSTELLFNINGQVNLRLGDQVIQYWDGTDLTGVANGSGAANGNGGAGTWNASNTNWTAATGFGVNDSWRSTVGVFAGAAGGTVTVDGNVTFQELRFETDGYALRPSGGGGMLNTTGGFSIVQVDSGLTADIGVEIAGAAGLTKTGAGTLILSALNSYAGATDIAAGTLRLGVDFALASTNAMTVGAGATFDLSTFSATVGSLSGAGNVQGSGVLEVGTNNASTTFSGTMTGSLIVSKSGTGTLTLTGTNTLSFLNHFDGTVNLGSTGVINGDITVFGTGFGGAPVFINDGIVNGNLGALAGASVDNNGTINGGVGNQSTSFTNDGTIRNIGTFALRNGFGGVFTNNAGGLIEGNVENGDASAVGTLNNAGTITGDIDNFAAGILNSTGIINGTLDNRGTVSLSGQLNGSLVNFDNGTVTLTGTTTGITSYNGQPGNVVLDLANFDTAIDAIGGTGEIRLGSATLTIGGNGGLSLFAGVISGSGGLTQDGTFLASLSGTNTYTGLTTVSAGTLRIEASGSVAGDVLNNATFENAGTVGGTLQNNSTASNSGTINEFVENSGTFTTTGIVNPLVSGLALTNNAGGTVNARGQINGLIQNSGTFNVTGALTGITRFNQFGTAALNLQGNDLAVGGLSGSGTVDLGSATLTVGVGNLNSTFGGEITGSGGLTKVGSDVFTLTGSNTYTGTTLVSGGTLRVAGVGTIAGPVVNDALLENFATIGNQITNNSLYTQIGTLNGNLINNGLASIRGQLNGDVDNQALIITLTGTTTGIGRVTQSAGALFDLNGFSTGFGSLSGEGEVRLGAATLAVGSDNSDTTFAGLITGSGAGRFAKVGTGTLILSGNGNNYSAATDVLAGTLRAGAANVFSGGSAYTIAAGATLDLNGLSQNFGSLAGAGNVTAGSALLRTGFDNSDTTFAGTLTGSGLLLKQGTGNWTLAGSVSLSDGQLEIRQGALTIAAGGIVAARVQVWGGAAAGNAGTINGDVGNDAGGTFGNSGTVNGRVLNDGALTSTGIINGNLFNASTGTVLLQGQLNGDLGNEGTVTLTGATSGIGRVTMSAGALFDLGGFNTGFGSLAGEGGEVRLGSARLTVGGDNTDSTFAGIVTGSGAGNGLTKVGTGTLVLSGANTYTGTTNVNAGTLTVGATGRIAGNVVNSATFNNDGRVDLVVSSSGTGTNGGTIAGGLINSGGFASTGIIEVGVENNAGATLSARGRINGFVNNSAIFNLTGALTGIAAFSQATTGQTNLNGFNLTVGALSGAGGINLGAGLLTVGTSNTNTTFSGVVSGAGGLTKVGTGTLVLAGANTYAGLTTVSAGTLGVSISGSLASAVVNNGTLLNDGTIGGLVTNDGTFASTGILNGGLTNNGTASLRGQLNGTVNNQQGSITLTGTLTGLAAFNQFAGATFNLAGFNATVGSLAGTGPVQLGGANLTVGGNNASTTFAGVISGGGGSSLTKIGTGTLTLSGANTYTGLTTVNAGTLTVAETGRLALLVNNASAINAGIIGAVDNRAGGTFANSGTVSNGVINAGTMSSTGIINLGFQNSGTAQLRGQLNGFVNANAGTIGLTGALTGITAFTQAAGATLNLNGFSLTVGSLSGAGAITFGGTAMTMGDFAPAHATPVQLAAAEMPAPAEAPVAAGRIVVTDSAAPAAATPLSGTGAAGRAGLVATESAAAAPASAGLEAVESPMSRVASGSLGGSAGTARIADEAGPLVVGITGGRGDVVQIAEDTASPAEANPVVLATGGTTLTPQALPPATGPVLTVGADNSSTIFAGVISGNGRLAKVGTGTLILTGNNTYTDGTLISGGVLQLGNGGTSGSIVGRIEVNGVLIVNRSDALTLSGIIDGAGLFVQAGTGTTTLTGANAYTNGTLISAGRLRGDSVSLQGLIQNDATLEFAQTTTGTFAGRMAGAGLVEKTGAGLLTYTGNNTFQTGQTRVLGGELRVNNLLNRSSVTVGNGGTLSGASVVGGIVAQSGGTVAPGDGGFGTLGVNGNMQFLAGSTFAAQVQPAGSDLLLGNGTAQLAGTIAVGGTAGVYRFNSVYVLLQADLGRTGTFGAETGLNTFGQAYAPRIVYTPTQVQLLLAPASLIGIAGPDGTPNQRSTLTRIDAAAAAGYDPQPLIALYNLTPRAAFLNGADQLSGEIYATSVRAALDDERLVREATFTRLRLTQDQGFGPSFGAWGHAVGAWGSGDTDGNAARYERDQQGFVVGVDGGGTWSGGAWRLGLLGHHLTTDISVDARGSNADIERSGAGVYGGLDFGGLRIRAGGTYSSLDLSGRRVAAFTGFTETLTGETDGEALQGFAEIAYRITVGHATHVEPYFQASHTRVEFDAFSETGGASRVRVEAEEDDLTTLAFGLRGSTLIPVGANTNLRLDGGLGARHLSGDRMIFSLIALDASPAQSFDIRSAALDRFAVTANLDATLELSRTVSLSVGYSGVVAANARDHAARATLGLRF